MIAASKHYIYIWQFRGQLTELNQASSLDLIKNKMTKEFAFYIEDNPNINELYTENFTSNRTTNDPICSIFANER